MGKGRLEAFSDGVIAVIITILVLEIKVPHDAQPEALAPLVPVFLSYVLSFVFIGIYWNNHHHLFHAVHRINGATLWANLHLLFWLSLVPFVTGWMDENHVAPLTVAAYGLVLMCAGIAYFILTRVLLRSHERDSLLAKALGNDVKGKVSVLIYAAAIRIDYEVGTCRFFEGCGHAGKLGDFSLIGQCVQTVAVAFARALRAAGIQRVYGVPGEDHLRLLDALPVAGICYVAAREENAAAIMAATEAQATGRVGVVLVTLAPGITNAINGIAYALLDRVPLLVVSGQHNPERAPVIVRQSLDTHRLVDSVCKLTLTASPRIHQVLTRALDTATAAPGGPVLLELREDIAAVAPMDDAHDWGLLQVESRTLRASGVVAAESLSPAVQALFKRSRTPAIVVGGGCPTDSATRAALESVAERGRSARRARDDARHRRESVPDV